MPSDKIKKNIGGYTSSICAGIKFRNKKKFRYGIPVYTDPFRALLQPNYLIVRWRPL
jgi:hypothetical protein